MGRAKEVSAYCERYVTEHIPNGRAVASRARRAAPDSGQHRQVAEVGAARCNCLSAALAEWRLVIFRSMNEPEGRHLG